MDSERPSPLKRRWRWRLSLALALLLGIDQSVQYAWLADGKLMGRRIAPFDPPLFIPRQHEALSHLRALAQGDAAIVQASMFDRDLGWSPKPLSQGHLHNIDEHGARRSAAPVARERRPGVRRLMTLGCSFTFGNEVHDEEAWPYLIDAAREQLEVVNLGFGAYGIDQALLRWERSGRALDPDAVWVGFVPAACLRVTTHYLPLVYHWGRMVLFKPRFQLGPRGELLLSPSPAQTPAQALALLTDQDAFLRAMGDSDMWIRRAPLAYAPRGSSWTHHFAFARLGLTWFEWRQREAARYLGDPESEVSRLLRAMLLHWRDELRARGKEVRLLVLPGRGDLETMVSDGQAYWTAFVESVERAGMRTLDVSKALMGAGATESDDCWMPLGHYSPLGNRLVAETVLQAWEPLD